MTQTPEAFGTLHFLGVIGISDTVRPNTAKSCQLCIEGGIQLVMLTGDRKETAMNVAIEIGLLEKNDTKNIVLTSNEMRQMSDLEVFFLLTFFISFSFTY